MQLDEWINLRTFAHHQFSDSQKLLQLKRQKNQTISLCLPTLNEAPTIGKIIKILKSSIYDKLPLVDEIIVVDSGSTDGTQEIAKKCGAQVFSSQEILPEMGNIRGKGENLWKSLFVANGDIILWLDTDIRNMQPHFVTGLLGPLLYHRDISFVKGCYRRPIKMGKKLCPTGGGRVTEILVKPFFNLLFTQLSLFNQPLSGEYCGRRELLERIPFFTGYGVETGLMIDVENRFGISCMSQVDLKVRIHRNQNLDALRKMAFGILKVLITRAEQQGKLVLMDHMTHQLLSVFKTEQEQYHLKFSDIHEIERPPMILCEAYQKKRELSEEDLILLDEIQQKRSFPFVSLSPTLDQRLIILDGKAKNKENMLKEISKLFVDNHFASDYPRLFHEFCKRENIMSTGIGSGVAIPHVISADIKRMKIAIYRRNEGIAFDSLDGQPVQLIFAVIAPLTRRQHYLQLLANLAMILKDEEVKKHLFNAAHSHDLLKILKKIEVVKRIEKELRSIES